MTTHEILAGKLSLLTPDLLEEVDDFIEFLIEKRRRSARLSQTQENNWPPGFFDQTAGVLADDPTFMRHPQGEYEERESLE